MFAPDVTNRLGKQEFGSNNSNASVSTCASRSECSLRFALDVANRFGKQELGSNTINASVSPREFTKAIKDLDAIPVMKGMLDSSDQHEVTKAPFDNEDTMDTTPEIGRHSLSTKKKNTIPEIKDMIGNFHRNADADSESDQEVDWTPWTRHMKKRSRYQMHRTPAMEFSAELLDAVRSSVENGIESDSDAESFIDSDADSETDDEADLPVVHCSL
eukprot:gnl/MRDRNA2_/MRDRNA2_84897_c0_seq1.p1 gnl/MRDRNA2_/MRDRNA2_84897_c0~~gnl/MRDRNA2_/MRDRNA2_84897_c0_seq1.p1  ORF type:complete len:216 (+),score=44.89 gnl/MRDRNA2_/MRDRNA2_84897_c0_seq1:111-758(+)